MKVKWLKLSLRNLQRKKRTRFHSRNAGNIERGVDMKKWEYELKYFTWRRNFFQYDIGEKLNKMGAEGWEIVSFPSKINADVDEGVYVLFKRHVRDNEE